MPKKSHSHMWNEHGLCIACRMRDDWPGATQLCVDATTMISHFRGSENARKRIEKHLKPEE